MKKYFIITLLLVSFAVLAQPGMPNNPTPVDGLTGILIAGGAAIGLWSRNKRK